ncbi:MAG: hypothetical protein E7421_02835 [Ruminococcaceae bacterium]|nr:hypothetical protein [Oscillospiraceae bacterium]
MKDKKGFSYICFRVIRFLIWLFYPKITVEGQENLPEEACIVVGNHTKMNGPICGELYFPGKRKIWCAHQMMYIKEVPQYAFTDFWSEKPKWSHWFYKMLSYIIAPVSVCVFTNAKTIPVFRDNRLITTFKKTIGALEEGENVIIYPECYTPHNHIVHQFQDKFIDVAKLYYKRTGKAVCFVPMYVAPDLKKVYLGVPTRFNPEAPMEAERERIVNYLMDEVTAIAVSLPRHRVVPYPNIPKKDYPYNKEETVL